MKKLIAFLSVLLPLLALAIETPNPSANVWPQSPKAAQIQEVTMPTPSLVTGACEFSVPLYTVSVEGVELPLALSYRSNGIKPDDDPQPIGYGWSLTPTFRISRQIKGRPDEYFKFIGNLSKENFEGDYDFGFGSLTMWDATRPEYLDTAGRFDTEHDIFRIQLPGTTLTMIMDEGKFFGPGYDEYRVEGYGKLDSILVTDPKGILYSFSISGEMAGESVNRTEWLLGSVTLPSGRRITFDWARQEHAKHGYATFGPRTIRYSGQAPHFLIEQGTPEDGSWSRPCNYFGTHDLAGIRFPGGKVEISYQGAMMTSLKVLSESGTAREDVVYEATLGHDENCRLLTSLEIAGNGTYRFDYDPQRFVSGGSVDWWGYCNGKLNDHYQLSPSFTLKAGQKSGFCTDLHVESADRSVDTEKMKANILTGVTYPTGGRVEWDYEAHRFETATCPYEWATDRLEEITLSEGGGLRVKEMRLYELADDPSPRVRRYVYGKDGDGKAEVTALPFLHTFFSEMPIIEVRPDGFGHSMQAIDRYLTIGTGSDYMFGQDGRMPLWYSQVTEIEEEGKTEYYFKDLMPQNQVAREWGGAIPVTNFTTFSQGPVLTNTKVFSLYGGSYSLVEETINNYEITYDRAKGSVSNIFAKRSLGELDFTIYAPDRGPSNEQLLLQFPGWVSGDPFNDSSASVGVVIPLSAYQWYVGCPYLLELQREQLISTEHRDYRENGTITRKTTNSYVPGTSLISKTVVTDNSSTITTEFSYAEAQSASVSSAMKAANVVGVPTLVTETFGSAKVGYRLEMQQYAASGFRPAKVWNIAGNETWSTADFDFDRFGNLTVAATADGCTTVTEWSDGLYPVKSTLSGKLVSTADWRPLVGVTKLTAPGSPTLKFDYDQCGRLVLATENGITTESHFYSITPDGLSYVTSRAYAVREGVPSTETTTCYDGLGRPWCAHTASGDVSVATLTEYDGMGRPWRQWAGVPMASAPASAASFRSAATSFYNTSAAFSQTSYEPSPRRLTTAVTRPGDGWDTHPATVRRLTNSSPWPRFVPTESGVSKSGTYPVGSLSVEEASDEDGVTVTKYADMRGLTIAEDRGGLVIHYVYDDYGRLRYVLPPGMNVYSSSISRSSAEMQGIAYWYDYDSRGRCTSKKLPGVDPITYYYDPADRLVVEFNPAFVNDCRVYGYDYAGRMVVTAEGNMSAAQAQAFASKCQTATFGGGSLAGYSISGLPSGFEAVTASYYDSYNFITALSLPSSFSKGGYLTLAGNVYGLLTGTYTGAGYEAYHYDSRMRMKVRVATGFNEGRTEFEYNNGGSVTSEKWIHPEGSVLADRGLTRETSYDSGGRISGHTVTQARNPLNDVPVIQPLSITLHDKDVASLTMEYDPLGRLTATNLNGTQANRITTSYNIHGWPTARAYISGGTTKTSETYTYAPFYNGNMASKQTYLGTYDYSYDANNRLVEAKFTNDSENAFRCYSTSYTYDERGNATFITRDGIYVEPAPYPKDPGNLKDLIGTLPPLDSIVGDIRDIKLSLYNKFDYDFVYSGNQIQSVDITQQSLSTETSAPTNSKDGGTLEYDNAGRIIRDDSRGIRSIEYDSNSHPVKITFDNHDTQEETWDALGNHISTVNTICRIQSRSISISPPRLFKTVTRKYHGSGQILEDDDLVMTRFTGGFFDGEGKVKFYLNDYQGNNIAVIDANGDVVEQMGYYPYGMPWSVPESTPYLFADKEYQHLSGLDEYIHGARRSVPYACAFSTPDPLCEDRRWESPYLFCSGNPIRNIDPSGEEPSDYESALMSGIVYRDRSLIEIAKDVWVEAYSHWLDKLVQTGWKISEHKTSIKKNHSAGTGIGMQSMLFERETENGTEYAYVFAGTNSWEDCVEDVTQLLGISAQLPKALENANQLISELGNCELTFIGHSAGGFLATGCGMATGRKAITFNTAVISVPTRLAYGLQETGEIDNYISSTPKFFGSHYPVDYVTVAQGALYLKAPGNYLPVVTGWEPTHSIKNLIRVLERK